MKQDKKTLQSWHERWEAGRIFFHQEKVTPDLPKHYASLSLSRSPKTCLVPLCGKSLDMAWLAEKGHRVFGIELSKIAIESFFQEQNISDVDQVPFDSATMHRSKNITLIEGDIFDIDWSKLPKFDFVFDRAALVALEPSFQKPYARQIAQQMNDKAEILLVGFDFDPNEMAGPPFRTPLPTIKSLYGNGLSVATLEEKEDLDEHSHLRDKGLTRLQRIVVKLTKEMPV